jgi:ribosomal protein S18 acetylase RimI-like enzyme
MNVVRRGESITLRPAVEDDAEDIYRLKREAFGRDYLLFTIYRSEKAVAHIRRSIASGNEIFSVAEHGGELAGYANVGIANRQPILNYLAVSGAVMNRGFGSSLLVEIESAVLGRTYGTLMLDVFASNPRAREWYARSGYSEVSRSFLYRIDLTSFMRKDRRQPVSSSYWQSALDAEKSDGFSKVVIGTGEGNITLGLIGGSACKLLGYGGITLDEAIAIAAATVNGTRGELIVSSLEAPRPEYQLLSQETALRMLKNLQADQ